tara:strand:- start:296 stop:607 length:312 start_codon:yes stop_codon:yes gene_type:complete
VIKFAPPPSLEGSNILMPSKLTDTDVNLAIYMERLDTYIQSQTVLNNSLCENLERINEELKDINLWRHKVYGAKTFIVALGILILHTSAVMGSFVVLMKFMDN